MNQLRFAESDVVIWLLLVPVVWIAVLARRALRERARRASGLGPRAGELSPMTGLRRDLTFLVLATIATVALVAAAARPQIPARVPEFESVDLILLLDRSASMQAEDIRPSRLQRAGQEIRNFLTHRPNIIARIGLIGFAGASVTLSHPTSDPGVILFFLDWIEEDTQPLYGTNMTRALESALDLAHKDMPERRKVVVIVSDGEDHGGSLDMAVAKFVAGRIPIYTVGIGSNAEVPIPIREGGVRTMLIDDDGTPITTRFNESTLRWIAGETGGHYYRSITGNELGTALADIAARERRIVRWRDDEYHELYPWGLLVAAAGLAWMIIIL